MRVRAIDTNGDWLFGKGQADYKVNLLAVMQNIQTRLNSFLGDCFFATNTGIDWWNLLGTRGDAAQTAINLAVSSTILGTPYVTGITQLSLVLNSRRNLFISYSATTVFGSVVTQEAEFTPSDHILTQSGEFLTDESGNPLVT